MSTDQRPGSLPPFFHELTAQERLTLSFAQAIRAQLELVYRLLGQGRSTDERDSRIGWLMEIGAWFAEAQAIGDRVQREYASRADQPKSRGTQRTGCRAVLGRLEKTPKPKTSGS